jgi:hypothetical protein
MPAVRLSRRTTREILRLRRGQGRSLREVARSCGIGATTVHDVMARAMAAGLTWPLPADLDDAALEARLYPPLPVARDRGLPDFAVVARAPSRPDGGKTLYRYSARGINDTRFASHLVMDNMGLRTVQELLGRKDPSTTVRYAHLSPGHQAAAVEKLTTAPEAPPEQAVAAVVHAAAPVKLTRFEHAPSGRQTLRNESTWNVAALESGAMATNSNRRRDFASVLAA